MICCAGGPSGSPYWGHAGDCPACTPVKTGSLSAMMRPRQPPPPPPRKPKPKPQRLCACGCGNAARHESAYTTPCGERAEARERVERFWDDLANRCETGDLREVVADLIAKVRP